MSKGAGVAALVLIVVTGATVAGIIGSNEHHGVTPAAAAGLPSSSSAAETLDPVSAAETVTSGSASAVPTPSSSGPAVVAIAQPKSQGRPGIVPVPWVPRATAGPIPLLAWEAYHRAAAGSGCKLPWYVLAGIGKIESNHGRYGGAQYDVTGTVHPSIFGPPTAYGRAMGPMQFIPPTWASYAADGNNDDITNPQNIFDATKAAAHYLCAAGGPDLSGLAAQRRAVFAYNHLTSYVDDVLAFATAYQHSEPEKVVHLVPIVYPKAAVKVAATTAVPSSTTGRASTLAATTTSVARTSTSSTTATSGTSTTPTTTAPSTTAAPTSPTCATTTSVPSTSASATSAVPAATSDVPAATSAVPAMTSGSTSAVPMGTTAASSTTSTSPTSPTCPPCPTSTPTPTPTPTPTTSASPSTTAPVCPTSATPTSPTTAARGTARRTQKP